MSKPDLLVDWRRFRNESARLQGLVSSLEPLSLNHRKLVAEIAMVRLFLLAENTVASVCAKLLCGAAYLDGRSPKRIVSASSKSNAENLMKQYGRKKPKRHLSWTQSREIRDNLKNTLQSLDPIFIVITNHGSMLTEMRYVRNHIVHNSDSSRLNFRKIVRNYYGGLKRGITPSILLLTDALGSPPLVEKYLAYYRIFIGDLVHA